MQHYKLGITVRTHCNDYSEFQKFISCGIAVEVAHQAGIVHTVSFEENITSVTIIVEYSHRLKQTSVILKLIEDSLEPTESIVNFYEL